ncbi:hypothetical protein [Crocosphaera sp. XPORK-15E]|uniref:hypothetical protein n=1 Tax=Crocosphaera sp. XPORK-15E TaxID=3110247 RepID=UPI002B207A8C|nr:hypothetical protein [Crocosphaera sp. XPORK-15E]MEA5536275.1 hypothetical protein [Crocosphaera sp. XPORK-15E]
MKEVLSKKYKNNHKIVCIIFQDSGFFYDFSNYGSYERLTDDGLTQWHPAFLQLGNSLEDCARKYKGFCQRYKPKEKKTFDIF